MIKKSTANKTESYATPLPDWGVGLALALAALVLYSLALAPAVLPGDAGEFQFVPWLPGIAHPTGYPLYTLLGWLWTHLFPLGTVAWRMNLLSALLGAATVGLVYALARRLLALALPETTPLGRVVAAALVALLFALTPTFRSQAIIAEVDTLHLLLVTLILLLALGLPAQECRGRRVGLLALVIGLGLAHHVTTVLLLPGLLLYLGYTCRNKARLAYLGLAAVPLLLYLYLPLIAPTTPYATLHLGADQPLVLYENSPSGLWQHVTGAVFAGQVQPAALGLERFRLAWQLLRQQVGLAGVALALVGLAALGLRRKGGLLMLTGLGWLAFVAFNLVYFIGDVFVLFIPAWLFVCLWLGLGALALARRMALAFIQGKGQYSNVPVVTEVGRRLSDRVYALLEVVGVGLLLVGIVVSITMRKPPTPTHNTAERWQAILAEPIPPEAVLISNDRDEIMPMWYYQYVEKRRPDLLGLFPLVVTDPAYANVGRLLDEALASGRPVYLIKPMPGLSLKANLAQAGSLFRATPIDTRPSNPYNKPLPEIIIQQADGGQRAETVTLAGYDIAPATLSPGDEATVTLYWHVTESLSIDYTGYVHLVDEAGQGIAQSDHRPGGDFYPSSHWQTGETLRDRHTFTVPGQAPTGVYHLRAGMYYQPSPGQISSMGQGVLIGPVVIEQGN